MGEHLRLTLHPNDMCGIAGVIGTTRAQGRHLLGPMSSEMSRRGPDAEDIEVWDHAALGHRRLSIFDLSDCGRQPMLTPTATPA